MAQKIDGNGIAASIRSELSVRVETLKQQHNIIPSLAVIVVGSRSDSATYIRMKQRAAVEIGVEFLLITFAEDTTEQQLIEKLDELSEDKGVHGIIVQLPLPAHLNEHLITSHIVVSKDVDGLHIQNIGKLALKGFTPLFTSCTPKGCIVLLDRLGIEIEGKDVVVVGRSNIVGIPISLLLIERNATVTICHSRTMNLPEKVRSADIVIVAIGKPKFVIGDWIKPGAIVIDVGINTIPDASKPSGYALVGDVDYSSASQKASFITPVPGGVGPMTVAMLLENTIIAAERAIQN